MGGVRNDLRYLSNSPRLMTLIPSFIVFFAEKCVNSPGTFFLWVSVGEDLPVRGGDDELVFVELYLSASCSQVPTFSFARCSVLFVLLVAEHLKRESNIDFPSSVRFHLSRVLWLETVRNLSSLPCETEFEFRQKQ